MSVNWADVVARLIGDGIIMGLVILLVQSAMNKQNLEFGKRKRKDYYSQRNYDKLALFAERMSQVLMTSFIYASRAEEGNVEHEDLWGIKFKIFIDDKEKEITVNSILSEYDMYINRKLYSECVAGYMHYNPGDYGKAKELFAEAQQAILKKLNIERSLEEIRSIFTSEEDKAVRTLKE